MVKNLILSHFDVNKTVTERTLFISLMKTSALKCLILIKFYFSKKQNKSRMTIENTNKIELMHYLKIKMSCLLEVFARSVDMINDHLEHFGHLNSFLLN